jgi:hypothetical protein
MTVFRKILATSALWAASTSQAQPLAQSAQQSPGAAPRPVNSTITSKYKPSGPSHVALDMSIGTGQYPVLEMPIMENSTDRVDGSNAVEDQSNNQGILLNLKLGWRQKTALVPYSVIVGAQRLSSAPGAAAQTPSSYARLNIETALHFDVTSTGTSLSPSLEARRSMYRNVDTGHYVDAVVLGSGIEQKVFDKFNVGLSAGIAPWTRFGVLQNSDFGKSGALDQTTATLSEFASRLTWTPEPETSFYVGFSQESVTVKMNSTNGYRSYGIPAAPMDVDQPQKIYNLTVRQMSIGTSKRF